VLVVVGLGIQVVNLHKGCCFFNGRI